MLRNYMIFIVVLGVIGSMLGRGGAPKAHRNDVEIVAPGGQDDRSSDSQYSRSSDPSSQDGEIQIDRSADGHFYADVQINGATVHMMVDTGASGIALSRDDARSAGVATSIGMPEVVGR